MIPQTSLGVAATSYLSVARPRDTLAFLEQQARNGAGGIQMAISSFEPGYLKKLRGRAEALGMFLELMGPLPKPSGDAEMFRRIVAAGRELGARCIRCGCLAGRRYESFDTLEAWKAFVDESRASLLQAASIVEKEKFPLALENHKDWTTPELVALMKQLSSEYFGVCLDTGNNIALLEDPGETIDALLPWTITTHLKDMAIQEYEGGFLLSEVVFGEGMLDIPGIVARVRQARPRASLVVEMITRDPLRVPCLASRYWTTFPDRSGYLLAKTLRMTRQRGQTNLPVVSHLSRDEQGRLEDENVRKCLDWAVAKLGL